MAIQEFAEGLLAKSRKEAKKSRKKSILTAGLFLGVGIGNKVLRGRAANRVAEMNNATNLALSTAKTRFDKSVSFLEDYNNIMTEGKGNPFPESYKIWYRNSWLAKHGFQESAFRNNPQAWQWLNTRVNEATADDIAAYQQQYEIAKEFEGPEAVSTKWNNYSETVENNIERLSALAAKDSNVASRLMSIFRGDPKVTMDTHHIGDNILKLPTGKASNNFIELLKANMKNQEIFDLVSRNFEYNDFDYSGYEALNLGARNRPTVTSRNTNIINILEEIQEDNFDAPQFRGMQNTFYNEDGSPVDIKFQDLLHTLSSLGVSQGQTSSTLDQFLSTVQNIASLRQNTYDVMMHETRQTAPDPAATILETVDLLAEYITITNKGRNIQFETPSSEAQYELALGTLDEDILRYVPRVDEFNWHNSIEAETEEQRGSSPSTLVNFLAETRKARTPIKFVRRDTYQDQLKDIQEKGFIGTITDTDRFNRIPMPVSEETFENIENTALSNVEYMQEAAKFLLEEIDEGILSASPAQISELRSLTGDTLEKAAGKEFDEEDAIQSSILGKESTGLGVPYAYMGAAVKAKLAELDDGESFLESIGLPLAEEDKEHWKSVVGPRWEGIKDAIREYDRGYVIDFDSSREREERIIPITNELNETISNFVEDLWNKRPESHHKYGPRERMARLELLLAGITNSVLGYTKFGPKTPEEKAVILEVTRLKDMEEAGRKGEITEFQERDAEEAGRDSSRTQQGALLDREYTSRASRVENRRRRHERFLEIFGDENIIKKWNAFLDTHNENIIKKWNAFLDTPLGPNSQRQLRDLFRR